MRLIAPASQEWRRRRAFG